MPTTENIDISVVVPAYNEEESVPVLIGEIAEAMKPLDRQYEIIIVDDGSDDRTRDVLVELTSQYKQLRWASHVTNLGQSAGMATGFQLARGSIIITLDADGQNNPADIPKLLSTLSDGVDCVCGIRAIRRDTFVRRASSKIANGFRSFVIGDTVTDAGCAFRVIRQQALKELFVFNGMHRFLPTILQAQGYRVAEIQISHRERALGQSKYGINNRLWRGIRDCFALKWYRARAIPGNRRIDD